MTEIVRRAWGLPVAIAVLIVSASVALAGAPVSTPDAAADGLAVAAEASGTAVPAGPGSEAPEAEPAEEPAEEPEPAEEEAAEAEPAEDERPDTHGTTVSEAAHMETPDGFANHGEFVSCVARMPHGGDAPAIDLSAVTPESCVRDKAEDDAEAGDDAEAEPAAAAAPARSERGRSAERGRGAERSAEVRAARG